MVDYHDFTTIDTPLAERRHLNVGDVWINAARCRSCGEEVRSRNRHDFRSCSCGDVTVDGGSFYCKRLYRNGARFTNHIVSFNDAEKLDE